MTPDFNVCDVCGARVPKEHRFFVATDRTYNGIENVTEGDYVDLCAQHANHLLMRMIGACLGQISSYEMGKKLLAALAEIKRG